MMMISIAENRESEAEALRRMVEDYCASAGIAAAVRTYAGGMELVRSTGTCDLLLLSYQMEKLDGLETARILRKLGSTAELIFLSDSAEPAIHGYEVGAMDFLLKPVSAETLRPALDRAVRRLESRACGVLALKVSGGTVGVAANDITYIEVFDHNLVYHTVKGDYNVRGRLSDVYEQLDPERFLLCSRSFIVNMRHVSGIFGDHLMVSGAKIPVSKSHRRELLDRFAGYLENTSR